MARVTCVVGWVLILRRVVTSVTEGLSGMKSAEQAYRIRLTNTILNGFAGGCRGGSAAGWRQRGGGPTRVRRARSGAAGPPAESSGRPHVLFVERVALEDNEAVGSDRQHARLRGKIQPPARLSVGTEDEPASGLLAGARRKADPDHLVGTQHGRVEGRVCLPVGGILDEFQVIVGGVRTPAFEAIRSPTSDFLVRDGPAAARAADPARQRPVGRVDGEAEHFGVPDEGPVPESAGNDVAPEWGFGTGEPAPWNGAVAPLHGGQQSQRVRIGVEIRERKQRGRIPFHPLRGEEPLLSQDREHAAGGVCRERSQVHDGTLGG